MKLNERLKANYYWVIGAVTVLALVVCGGIGSALSGVVRSSMTGELNIGEDQISLEVTILSGIGVVINLLSGVLFIKFGYRKLIFACMALSGLGYMLGSFSNNLLGLCLAAILGGMYGVCNRSGTPRILSPWFHRHYGTIMGFITCMTGFGGGLFSQLFQKTEAAFGWRGAYRLAGFCCLAVALLVLLLIRNKPSDIGVKPYGEGELTKNVKKSVRDHWEGFDMSVLKKKPTFYMMIAGTFLSSACVFMCFYVIPTHSAAIGMTPEEGATAQALMLYGLGASKLVFGYLSDRIGAKSVTMIALLALTVSLLMLASATGRNTMYAATSVYSISLSLTIMAPTLLTPSLFGYRAGAKAMGVIMAAAPAANMVAPLFSGALYEKFFGSYTPIFRGTAIASVLVIGLYIIMYILANRDKKKFLQAQEV